MASFAKIGSRQTGVTPATGRGGVSFPEISYWRWHSPVVYWRLAGAVVTVTVRHPANQPTNPPASHSHPALPQQQVSPTQFCSGVQLQVWLGKLCSCSVCGHLSHWTIGKAEQCRVLEAAAQPAAESWHGVSAPSSSTPALVSSAAQCRPAGQVCCRVRLGYQRKTRVMLRGSPGPAQMFVL